MAIFDSECDGCIMRKAVVKIASFHHFGCKPPRCGKGNAVTVLIADHKRDGGINLIFFNGISKAQHIAATP